MGRWGQSRAFIRGGVAALTVRFCVPCNAERAFRGRRCTWCKKAEPKASKYGNVPTRDVPKPDGTPGRLIHSRKEARRLGELRWLEKGGEIRNLQEQVRFPLEVNGLLITTYVADFVYEQRTARALQLLDAEPEWVRVVEDSKGYPNETYPLKKRLMLAVHGIEVLET